MSSLRRFFGIVLMVIGIVVAVHTVIEPLYYISGEDSPYSPAWTYINLLMVLSIILGVFYSYIRTRDAGNDALVTREYLVSNIQLYGFLFVGIAFFWNWFQLSNDRYTAIGTDVHALVWLFIDAALPLLTVTLGLHLVRGAGRS